MTNAVTENYMDFLTAWKETKSDKVVRPAAGNYALGITALDVDTQGDFRYGDGNTLPALVVRAHWHLSDDPSFEDGLDFPGRLWALPKISASTFDGLPANQKQRIDIQFRQFKGFVIGLLGYEPDDPQAALEGFSEHVATSHTKGETLQFSTRITYQKKSPDSFDREIVDAAL